MAWENLPTNYTDAVWSGLKKYVLVTNDDGTISLQDVTIYSGKENSFFGAKQANQMNEALNTIMRNLEDGSAFLEDFFVDLDAITVAPESAVLLIHDGTSVKGITAANLQKSKVNISDIINNLVTDAINKPLSAAQGVVLKKLIDTLQTATDGKAPKSHAASGTDYGAGSGSNYGHVKLSDATDGTSNANGGVAATPAAVKAAYDLAKGKAPAEHGNHVPATETADNARFLRNDNTWQKVTPANIGAATPKDVEDAFTSLVIPSGISAVEHQYAVSNSKDSVSTVETWNKITSPLSQRERSCIFANGYYAVCGAAGEVGYSKDGVNWTTVTPFVSGTLTNIAYGKGKFIIVDEFDGLWMAEETPLSWTKIDTTFTSGIGSLVYANNRFVIAGTNMAAFSEDGIKWTEVEAPGSYNQIAFGGGRYVAVGAGGAVGVSYDGVTWVDRSNPAVTGDLRGVVYAKGKYIIGGIDGLIMSTEDFTTWSIATSNSAGVRYVRQITYAENKYYAACYTSGGAGEIWTSLDGISWTVQQQMNARLWCLSYNDGKLISAGDSGAVYVLDLGIVWQTKQPDLSNGQYLWERIVITLSDGGQIVGDAVFIKAPVTTANIIAAADTNYTALKARPSSLNSVETVPTLNGSIAWTYE